MKHYEDLEPGHVDRFGAYAVSREEVLGFSRAYDPQPFHLSDEAAATTHFRRLAASGWQTCAITMKLLVDHLFQDMASLGAAGIDGLRWVKPVYPGDTLSCEVTVLDKHRSASRPELGRFRSEVKTFNQEGALVLRFVSNGLIAVRDPAAP